MFLRREYVNEFEKNPEIISKRLKAAREHNSFSIDETSKRLGVDPNLIKAYEDGLYYPDVEFLILASRHFNVTIDYLCGYDDISKPSLLKTETKDKDSGRSELFYYFMKFLDSLTKLDENEKDECLKQLREILNLHF